MWGWILFLTIVAGIGYAIYRHIHSTKKIKQEKIVQQWTMLIEGANGFGEKVINDTIKLVEKVGAPNIHVSKQDRKPDNHGFIKESREFLIAEHKLFDTHDMYISARDYGKQLFVSWYLLEEPISFWRRFKRDPLRTVLTWPFFVIASIMHGGGGDLFSALNLFDTEELTAYVTTVHHALKESVNSMMVEQKIDFTKVERRTHGFLNIIP